MKDSKKEEWSELLRKLKDLTLEEAIQKLKENPDLKFLFIYYVLPRLVGYVIAFVIFVGVFSAYIISSLH